MKNERFKKTKTNWSRIILLSASIGLAVGISFWWWQNSAVSTPNDQIVTGNINRSVVVEGTKPIVLSNNLPATDRHLELLGDKLAEASFHLREQHTEDARQALNEANEFALKTNDNARLRKNLTDGIKQAQSNIADSKTDEAEQEINLLLDQLNMPEN